MQRCEPLITSYTTERCSNDYSNSCLMTLCCVGECRVPAFRTFPHRFCGSRAFLFVLSSQSSRVLVRGLERMAAKDFARRVPVSPSSPCEKCRAAVYSRYLTWCLHHFSTFHGLTKYNGHVERTRRSVLFWLAQQVAIPRLRRNTLPQEARGEIGRYKYLLSGRGRRTSLLLTAYEPAAVFLRWGTSLPT